VLLLYPFLGGDKMATVIDAVIRLKDSFTSVMDGAAKSALNSAKQIQRTGKSIESTGKSLGKVGSTLTKSVTVPTVAIGTALLKLSEDFESAENTIRSSTGTTGSTLESLNGTMKSVYSNVASSLSDTSTAVSDVYKRLGLSGKPLQTLSTQFLNLSRITGTDLTTNIQTASQAFKAMNLTSSQYSGALDQVYKASQSTGQTTSDMLTSIQKYAPALKELGLNFSSSTALVGGLSKSGVNVQQVMTGLTKGISTMAKSGITDANKAVKTLFDQIKAAPNSMTATKVAVAEFGTKAGPALATAVREGKLNYADLLKTISSSSGTISKATADTSTPLGRLKKLGHQLQIAFLPVANSLMSAAEGFEPAIAKMVGKIKEFADWLSKLSPAQKEMVLKLVLIVAAAGPVIKIIGELTTNVGGVIKGFGKLGGSIKTAGGVMAWIKSPGHIVVLAITAIIIAIALVIKYWPQISAFVSKNKVLLIGLAVAIGAITIVLTVAKIAQALFNVTMGLCPITWIIVGIVAVVAVIVLLITHWKTVSTVMGNVFKNIKSGFKSFVNFIITGINYMISGALKPINLLISGLNKIPGVKIPALSITIPNVPNFATGTDYFSGGAAIINEKGGELVNLPNGSQVIPADKTDKALSSKRSVTINKIADYFIVREEADIDKISTAIVKKLKAVEVNM
jgi:TP901 family phage tail tape measure protein